jgi:succinoglycan biosynthesis transport protein ExoP
MNFTQFLLIMHARRKIILLILLTTVVAAVAISLLLPKTYKATTTLVLNYKGIDPVTGLALPAQLMPGYTATQVDIIRSQNVALRVIEQLKLAEGDAVKQNFMEATDGVGDIRIWLSGLLLKKLDVVPSRESSVLDINFSGAPPQFAAAVANAFAAEYQGAASQFKTEPMKRASTYLDHQVKVLRSNLEGAQNKLSKYQQDKGIVTADNRLDVETARLNELSAQLVMVQGQVMEASSRQRQTRVNAGESPDVLANPLVQNLKASLAQAEAKFSEIAQRLARNHPQYQSTKAEVDKLRAQLNEHIAATSNSIGNNARILQQREAELRAAVAAQKAKVLELNRARDELAMLAREVDSVQRAYDGSMQRLNQTSLEGSADQTEVAVLNPATAPIEAASPKLVLNTLLAIFLGTMFGVGVGLLAELLDRRVRMAGDLAEVLQAPVLGVMPKARLKRRRSLARKLFLPRSLAAR